MEHLTMLDASFLQAEDSDPHVSLAVGGVSIIEGPPPDYGDLVSAFAERAQGIPRCTQVLHTRPFDLGAPEWVDDPHFDIAHHLHRVALPHPGDDAELFGLIASIMEQRLDRDRPLWECWIIEGLTDNRWALLMKIHHCIADGIATAQMLAKLSDGGAGETFASSIRAAKGSGNSILGLLRPRLNPLNWMNDIWRATLAATSAAEHAVVGAAELTAHVLTAAPESSLNGPVTKMRRFSAARVDLAVMKQVCRDFDVTLNDVALAAITSSYRTMLLDRGETPGPLALRTLVPVSMRSADDFDVTDNRVSAMLPLLPVDEPDPVKQLEIVHRRLTGLEWSTGRRQCRLRGCRQCSVCILGVGDSTPDPTAAEVGDRAGDERTGAPRTAASAGSGRVGDPAGAADRPSPAHRDRDAQLRRPILLRHHRRLRQRTRRRRARPRDRGRGAPPGGPRQLARTHTRDEPGRVNVGAGSVRCCGGVHPDVCSVAPRSRGRLAAG
jgi:WS/DGAT/MGAT family acyltransferase